MMTKLRIIFNGAVIGIFLTTLLTKLNWWNFNLSVGWLIPLIIVGTYLLYIYYGRHLRQNWAIFRFSETLWITIISFTILLAAYHLEPLIVVLGSIVKKMLFLNMSEKVIGLIVLVVLLIWLIALGIDAKIHPVVKIESGSEITKLTLQSKISLVLTILFLVLLVVGYYVIPSYHDFINRVSILLMKMDIKALRDYINSFGAWGPFISALLMVFQSVVAPLPAFVLTFANAYLYGWYFGAALSWGSSMLGALLCFYIARGIGRPFAEKIITKNALAKMDGFFNDYGDYTIIILRLLPFVSFDEVSYGAGFTDMKVGKFLIATGIGQLPATIVYSFVGGSLDGNKTLLFIGIITFIILVTASLFARKVVQKKRHKENLVKGKE